MRKSLSIYLDLLRLFAAVGVLLGHASTVLMPWEPDIIAHQASECVSVFFVLSGFVIGYVADLKETDWKSYVSARFARISSVVLLAIAVGSLLDFVGSHINIRAYQIWAGWNMSPSIKDLISYLTFTNEIWFRHSVVGTLEPYWSLGFEVSYYVMFGLFLFLRGNTRIMALIIWGLIVGPKIVAFLPVWFIGVGTYWLLSKRRASAPARRVSGATLIILTAGLYYLVRYKMFHHNVLPMYAVGWHLGLVKSAIYYYSIGGIVALNIIAFDWMCGDTNIWARKIGASIRWFAGATFSIYLFHLPMEVFAAAIFPEISKNRFLGVGAVVTILALIYLLAELGERRKSPFKRLADAALQTSGNIIHALEDRGAKK